MAIQGSREGNDRKGRAVLLLSLILLVWNAGATAPRIASLGNLPFPDGASISPVLPSVADNETGVLSSESPRSVPLSVHQKYLLGKRIDINKASLAEIGELPGISDEVAAAVLAERERLGRFRSPEDLLGVRGIKRKRLQKILPFLAEMPNN